MPPGTGANSAIFQRFPITGKKSVASTLAVGQTEGDESHRKTK